LLDLARVYFSARLGTERKRVFLQVKPQEDILALFSGSGIYPITIAKNAKPHHILAVEANPHADRYARQNVITNKVSHLVTCVKADATKYCKTLSTSFDRIVMPLPKNAHDYLQYIASLCKKNTIIHLYHFCKDDEMVLEGKLILERCKKLGIDCAIVQSVKCGQYGPHLFRVCFDLEVKKLI
jgi:tRNA (guanine37-N1)-methyltransferase